MKRQAWLLRTGVPGLRAGRDALRARLEGAGENAWEIQDDSFATSERLNATLDALRAQPDDLRLLWLAGHGVPEDDLGRIVFFDTADEIDERSLQAGGRPGYFTLNRLWRALNEIASDGRAPIIAVVDACHAIPRGALREEGRSPWLIAITPTRAEQQTPVDATEGPWLTRRLAEALSTAGEAERAVDGRAPVTLFSIKRALFQGRAAGTRPLVIYDDHREDLVFGHAPLPRDDAELALRQFLLKAHERLPSLFEEEAPLVRSIHVPVSLALEHVESSTDLAGLLQRGGRWNLRGGPGAGKTTMARYLAGERAVEESGPLALYVSLPSWAAGGGDLLEEVLLGASRTLVERARGVVDAAHARGDLWLLLDGLDEVAEETARDRLHKRIAGIAAEFDKASVVVLGRLSDAAEGFSSAQVNPLGEASQLALLRCRLEDPSAAEDVLERCLAANLEVDNPLLLTLVALLARGEADLPGDLAGIYREAVSALLCQAHRGRRGVRDQDRARPLLRALALELHREDREDWSRPELLAATRRVRDKHGLELSPYWPTEEAFLEELATRSALLGPHAGTRANWRFLHRALREQLVAEALVATPKLAAAHRSLLGDRNGGSRWGNIFVLHTSLVPQPLAVVELLREVSAHYALAALAGAGAHEAVRRAPARALALVLGTEGWDGGDLLAVCRYWTREARVELLDDLLLEPGEEGVWAARADRGSWVRALGCLWYVREGCGEPPTRDFFARRGFAESSPVLDPFVELRGAHLEFRMGSPHGVGGDDERPQRRVTLRPFDIAPRLVCNADYEAFAKVRPAGETALHPVRRVTWWEALLYARWAGADLPTEAEWECACRAGTETEWHWLEADLPEHAWFGQRQTRPVDEGSPNAWGICDMHGNLWEWCRDWYGPYREGRPEGPASGHKRVLRGGSFHGSAQLCRSGYRGAGRPSDRSLVRGFRLVRRPNSALDQ